MQSSVTPVKLLSYANDEDRDFLEAQLSDLGFKSITKYSIDDFNCLAKIDVGIVVIQIASLQNIQKKIITFLQNIRDSKTLVLFNKDTILNNDVVPYCDEVTTWPCYNNELAYRMRRLSCSLLNSKKISSNYYVGLNILGTSQVFTEVLKATYKISQCDAPVLVEGETGTGKEVIARAIHYLSAREKKPFIAINCGALPDTLIENELFGHDSGAYTDAKKMQAGLVSLAEGGTLFLDEIEALSLKGQITLLRFLQDYEYRPLGSKNIKIANIRIITASNESIKSLVESGQFRQDLYFRLNIFSVNLPPLRSRGEDVRILANHFIDKFRAQYDQPEKYLDPDSIFLLQQYSWPGNVRELENYLHREFVMSDNHCIKLKIIKNEPGKDRRKNNSDRRMQSLLQKKLKDAKQQLIDEFEIKYLSHALSAANGNIALAAKKAGKERRTFTKLLFKHGLDRNNYSTNLE